MVIIHRLNSKSKINSYFFLLSCLLLFIASPGQFSWGILAWIALIPLLLTISRLKPGKAARAGLTCGIIYYCAVLYWILIVLGKYGGLPLFASLPALFLLALYMSLFLAVFSACLAWSHARIPMVWAAPPLWVSLDYVRAHLFTGFPWLDLGYTQYQYPEIIQLADLTGHYGITFLIVLVNSLFVSLMRLKRSEHTAKFATFIPALVLLVAAVIYNQSRTQYYTDLMQSQSSIKVAVVQGNIDQNKKWLPDVQAETIDTYLNLSKDLLSQAKPQLIIWPETALPFFPLEHQLFNKITDTLIWEKGPDFITGAPHYTNSEIDQQPKYYNSAFILNPLPADSKDSNLSTNYPFKLSRYDKQHLVPFGEYIPLSKFLPSSMPLVHSMGNFSAGTSSVPFPCHNARIGVLICYESIFPDLARMEVANGANLLVNLTNDAWYGRSSAPWQQLAMVVFRAVENRKSFARAANTGISCFIDPLGRQLELSPLFEPYSMSATLPILREDSPFSRYGHNFPLLCLLSLVLIFGFNLISRNPSHTIDW